MNIRDNKLKAESISVIGDMTSLIELNLIGCGLRELPQRSGSRAIKIKNFFVK